MSRFERIREILQTQLKPLHLEIEDESSSHNVPPGSESHFRVVLVSEGFDGLSAVKRHQHIYALLKSELAAGLHALSLHCLSPSEWQKSRDLAPSPDCQHRRP